MGTADYDLSFVATTAATYLFVGGYQAPGYETATSNDVTVTGSGGEPNLLSSGWQFIPAVSGSFASESMDGAGVNALGFGGYFPGYYDVFYQSFATTVGSTYEYRFTLTEETGGPSGFEVSVSSGVPEPSTWAMMLIGVVGLGLVAHRRVAKKELLA